MKQVLKTQLSLKTQTKNLFITKIFIPNICITNWTLCDYIKSRFTKQIKKVL